MWLEELVKLFFFFQIEILREKWRLGVGIVEMNFVVGNSWKLGSRESIEMISMCLVKLGLLLVRVCKKECRCCNRCWNIQFWGSIIVDLGRRVCNSNRYEYRDMVLKFRGRILVFRVSGEGGEGRVVKIMFWVQFLIWYFIQIVVDLLSE